MSAQNIRDILYRVDGRFFLLLLVAIIAASVAMAKWWLDVPARAIIAETVKKVFYQAQDMDSYVFFDIVPVPSSEDNKKVWGVLWLI